MSFQRKVLQAALPALLIAGCSGDSQPFFPGDGGQLPAPATQLPITATNASAAAKEAYLTAVKSVQVADVALTVGSNITGGVTKPSKPSVKPGRLTELVLMAPFGPTVLTCTAGGTVSLSGDVASPTTLTVGDTVNLDYSACDSGFEVITGRVETTVSEYSENPENPETFRLVLDMLVINYQVTDITGVETTNGDAGVVIDLTDSPNTLGASVSGTSIVFDDGSSSTTLTNYSTSETFIIGGEALEFTVNTRGTVDTTLLEAPVTYSTPVDLRGLAFEFPSSGELLVTGDNSSVRVVALDSTNVRLDIDSNGDGEVDISVETTWTDIAT